VSERGGEGDGERWRAASSARFSREMRKGASERGNGMKAERSVVLLSGVRGGSGAPHGRWHRHAAAMGRACSATVGQRGASGRERKEAAQRGLGRGSALGRGRARG
jgi:hypothetical protein